MSTRRLSTNRGQALSCRRRVKPLPKIDVVILCTRAVGLYPHHPPIAPDRIADHRAGNLVRADASPCLAQYVLFDCVGGEPHSVPLREWSPLFALVTLLRDRFRGRSEIRRVVRRRIS